MTLTSESVFI